MSFFLKKNNCLAYIDMTRNYRPGQIIHWLKAAKKTGSTLLELGCGPGNDLTQLQDYFQVMATDYSPHFITYCRQQFRHQPVMKLDVTRADDFRNLGRRFDLIFSNKVMQQFEPGKLLQILQYQAAILNPGGLLAHTFWQGEGIEQVEDNFCQYYSKQTLTGLLAGSGLAIKEFQSYNEMSPSDSFFCLLEPTGPEKELAKSLALIS